MLDFLQRRAKLEETRAAALQTTHTKNVESKHNANARQKYRPQNSFSGMSTNNQSTDNPKKFSCFLCKEDHGIFSCSKFLSLSIKDRYETAKKCSVCTNCLRGQHPVKNCISIGCKKCGRRHNSLLHFDSATATSNVVSQQNSSDRTSNSNQSEHSNNASSSFAGIHQLLSPSEVVLATAIVDIVDNKGQLHPCRVMLDSGSQPHVVTDKFANKIGLKKMAVNIPLDAVNDLTTSIKFTANAMIRSRYNEKQYDLSLFVVNCISTNMPSIALDRKRISIPNGLFLADPEFHRPAEVDMILGAQYFYQFLGQGQISISNEQAVFQETELGWVVAGCFHQTHARLGKVYCHFSKLSDLPLLWEIDSAYETSRKSLEEEACEIHYAKTTTRDESGSYEVQLLFNEKKESIGESRKTAFNRFLSLESKFAKNPEFKIDYTKCIQTYLDAGHMTPIEEEKSDPEENLDSGENSDSKKKLDSKKGLYLPHHAVVKTSSITTKIRVVYDGSCKSSSGISLNDTLMVGPTIQEDLPSIFVRFRTHLFVLTADIEQMYRQVKIHKDDRIFHKILWRENPSDPIREYTLNTVTFGTSSAPFLAIRTLHQLANDEADNYPVASEILKNDFFVDDVSTGEDTFEKALSIRDDLISLLKKGGFTLRKWRSNDPRLINNLQNDSSISHMSINPSETIKTLGLSWNPSADKILYTVNLFDAETVITKRSVFSQTAKLFDPIGLLGPVTMVAKLLIQDLWKIKLTWDEIVPEEFRKRWLDYRNQLPLLEKVEFDRCITIPDVLKIELHGFSDASSKAYGAALYLRCTDSNGQHQISLICAKSRVTPLSTIKKPSNFSPTIPKLELCAAHLLARLMTSTKKSMKLNIFQIFLWCDNTTVLAWINTPPYKLQPFIANRVAEIQSLTNVDDWRYVATHDNPADYISRGQTPCEFLKNYVWRQGPNWLREDKSEWPTSKTHIGTIPGTKREFSGILCFKLTIQSWQLLEECSSFRKLIRIIALCLRFVYNIRKENKNAKITGILTIKEIETAHDLIIKQKQHKVFSKDMEKFSDGKMIDHKGGLSSLNPYLDENGIMRVGSRLTNAKIPHSQKFPIILPRNHHITKLIILDEHLRRMHAGAQATLYGVRHRYWPIDGRNTARHVIRKCVRCFKVKPRGVNYIMGDLPEQRLVSTRPFLNVGTDYCGPFFVKERRVRNRSHVKVYICIFICFSSKAVHLEVVCDLTTEAFLGCFKRFISRRGKPNNIYSDNATNFVGADREIQSLYKFIRNFEKDTEIQNFFLQNKINWQFSPPSSPHFGGLWEASVKSFKHHLLRVVGKTLLTYDQLQTYAIEIEAILNSRPLTPLSSDPNDLLPLSPGHLLIGSPLTSYPQEDLKDVKDGRLSSWHLAQKMRQNFWSRWQEEYINNMINRSKWKVGAKTNDVDIGTMVVLKEENLPPLMWKLGRVVDVHPGKDSIIRVVSVKTKTGIYKRSVKKLFPLPILSENEDAIIDSTPEGVTET